MTWSFSLNQGEQPVELGTCSFHTKQTFVQGITHSSFPSRNSCSLCLDFNPRKISSSAATHPHIPTRATVPCAKLCRMHWGPVFWEASTSPLGWPRVWTPTAQTSLCLQYMSTLLLHVRKSVRPQILLAVPAEDLRSREMPASWCYMKMPHVL